MFTVDLSLPFSALLIVVAGAVGYAVRGEERRLDADVDRDTPELRAFEQRQRKLGR